MNQGEDDVDFEDVRRSVVEVQDLLDQTIASTDEPQVKALLEGLSTTLRSSAADFFADGPATLHKLQAEITAAEDRLEAAASEASRPAKASAPPGAEPELPFDAMLGWRLRDELLARHGLTPRPIAPPPPAPTPETLEPYDFWSTSFSALSGIHPPPAKPATEAETPPKPSSSLESWLQRDSVEFQGSRD